MRRALALGVLLLASCQDRRFERDDVVASIAAPRAVALERHEVRSTSWTCTPWPLCRRQTSRERELKLFSGAAELSLTGIASGDADALVEDPEGTRVAFAGEGGGFCVVYVVTQRLLIDARTSCGLPAVDWSRIPTLLEVAPDLFRATQEPEILESAHKAGADGVVTKILIASLDVGDASSEDTTWDEAFLGLPGPERSRVLEVLAREVEGPLVTPALIQRAARRLPPTPRLADALAAHLDDPLEDHGEEWSARLAGLSQVAPGRASEIACRWLPVLVDDKIEPLSSGGRDEDAHAALSAIAHGGRSCAWARLLLDHSACDPSLRCPDAGAAGEEGKEGEGGEAVADEHPEATPLCAPAASTSEDEGNLLSELLAASSAGGLPASVRLRNERRTYAVRGAPRPPRVKPPVGEDEPVSDEGEPEDDPCGEAAVRENACRLPATERSSWFGNCRLDVDDGRRTLTVTRLPHP